ncbi:DHA2 family efflux MFS transporter permease subunit [uncultured Alsobacter sp.]|uniref:DHA2 family efflux MFS transporter permease subunit n=1 Tax=uncultured Alsobacter sp. TaxID=1748258 RepID=UPI0025DF4E76|nr:DHA2 family efflux MFS transporter permease subunit [uncultured Alsobacter sp.]
MARTSPALPRERLVPLIVATAMFMENLDSTVLATSLPAIAQDLGENPIHLKLAVTSYLLALAIFIPASGWVADRLGARLVFRAAIAVFAAGSIGCGFAHDMTGLIAGRVVQGIGGAMMVPVGRLVVLRSIDRSDLVNALAWLTLPGMLGPILGPPLGGFITAYFHWRWIFWVNIPIAVLGIVLVTLFIPDVRGDERTRFDALGFALVGPGLATFLTGATVAGLGLLPTAQVAVLIGVGAVLLAAYGVHALRTEAPIIDLRMFKLASMRASIAAAFPFRIAVGATPFLLPLMLQVAFGLNPFQSGLTTFMASIGALLMKACASPILRRWGFRRALTVNAVLAAVFIAVPGLFTPGWPWPVVMGLLLIGGFLRSLQFTALNAVAYAQVPDNRLSRATTLSAVVQELSGSVGVSVAALGLELMGRLDGTGPLEASHFPPVFAAMGCLAAATSVLLYTMLPNDLGQDLVRRRTGPRTPPAAEPSSQSASGSARNTLKSQP